MNTTYRICEEITQIINGGGDHFSTLFEKYRAASNKSDFMAELIFVLLFKLARAKSKT